jgi:hypothetical protein
VIRPSFEIMCDIDTCLDVQHLDAGATTPQQILTAAKAAGWTRRKLNGKLIDVCNHCTKALEHAKLRGSEFRSW